METSNFNSIVLDKHIDPSAVWRAREPYVLPKSLLDAEMRERAELAHQSPDRFPTHLLPGVLYQYVEQSCAALGCDPSYVAVPLLAVVASAIGNTRRIRLKPSWSEPAVIWTAVVGDSGTVKSPALELALRPVWRRQTALVQQYNQERKRYKTEKTAWMASVHANDDPPAPPVCQHAVCLDITIEALADRLLSTPRGTLIAPDELASWFGSFNQYKSGGGDVAQWLTLFGARPLKVDRKTGDRQTIYVPHAAVSVTGTVQPQTLQALLKPELFANGLTARLLMVMPASSPKRWTDHEIEPATDRAILNIFDQLYAMNCAPGIDQTPEPVMIDLAPDALLAWVEFVNLHGQQIESTTANLRAAYAKLEGYAARFALLFHCIRVITQDKQSDYADLRDIQNGIELARWFGEQTRKVYQLFNKAAQPDSARQNLVYLIRKNGGQITHRELTRLSRQYRRPGQAVIALDQLLQDGLGEWFYYPQENRAGPPLKIFRLLDGDE